MKKLSLMGMLVLSFGCGHSPSRDIAAVPELGKESIPPEEAEATKEILSLISQSYHHAKPSQNGTGRIIHHKEHGCVKARFEVLESLPSQLRHGIFSQTSKYDAWVRISNGSGKRQHDGVPDARGLAIKLMNVDGEKLGDELHTQDFLLQSAPNFFAKDVVEYVKFMKISATPGMRGVGEMLKDVNLKERADRESMAILAGSSDQPANPITTEYYSALPQKLGPHAIKLHARGCKEETIPTVGFADRFKKDHLKSVMKEHLDKRDACIELYVQVQTDAVKMPIENAMVTWDSKLSPFVPVARIHIPKQNFLSEKRQEFCEVVSFNPWHSIKEHRPLGGLNRVRKVVYEHSQKQRHTKNNQRSVEPKSGETYE